MAGIYIHIPFCKQACYYCNFHFSTSTKHKDEMLNAIKNEIIYRKNEIDESIETIYFGGGTPSLLSWAEITEILNTIYENYTVKKDAEITLEANPDDLTSQKIKEISKTYINRLSIGVQSFFDDDLQLMNRAHNASDSKRCITQALDYFNNITIDLIYGIPTMNNQKWLQNLEQTFQLKVPHISSYALTVEPKTALATFINKGSFPPINDELALLHFNTLLTETKKQGFIQYEISNFGKKDFFSKHNTSYWQGKPYLGFGPSAHSFNIKTRSWNVANNSKYIQAINKNTLPLTIEHLSKNDQFNELVMTGLRTIWGVSISDIKTKFGEQYKTELLKKATKFIDLKLLKIIQNKYCNTNSETLVTTKKGRFLADGIASDLFMVK